MKQISFYSIIFSFIFLFMASYSMAQKPLENTSSNIPHDEPNDGVIKKGTILIGTFFSFGNTFNTELKANNVKSGVQSLTLGTNITSGYMISNKWAALLNIAFTHTKTTNFDVSTSVSGDPINQYVNRTNYIFTSGMRYYMPVSEGNYFFLQWTGQFTFGNDTRTEINITKNTQVGYNMFNDMGGGIYFNPGFTSFISKKLAAEISIGVLSYSIIQGKDPNGDTTLSGGFQFLLYQNSANLGFVYYF